MHYYYFSLSSFHSTSTHTQRYRVDFFLILLFYVISTLSIFFSARQRDHNPLGNPLKRNSSYQNRSQAKQLLDGTLDIKDIREEKRELIAKYSK